MKNEFYVTNEQMKAIQEALDDGHVFDEGTEYLSRDQFCHNLRNRMLRDNPNAVVRKNGKILKRKGYE